MLKRHSHRVYLLFALAFFVLCQSTVSDKPAPYQLKYDEQKFSKPEIPVDNSLTYEGIYLGRLLFYDSILSGNGKQACGSCHIQKFAFTDGKKLAVGSKGDTLTRNTLSLTNLAWGHFFFWDGRAKTLEQLVRDPVTNPKELAQDTLVLIEKLNRHRYYPKLFSSAFPGEKISMDNVSKALAQFLRTITTKGIKLPDSVMYFTDTSGITEQQKKNFLAVAKRENSFHGTLLRFSVMCNPCHSGVLYGNEHIASNVVSPADTPMKAPSLINITLTAPYMHDGRFASLEEVLVHYDQHITEFKKLNPTLLDSVPENLINDFDRKNINRFFAFLTDSSMLTNPDYSNPFADRNFSWDFVMPVKH